MEDFFADKSLLITGATGFVGKVLLEKLLRSCPRVSNVFVLLRPKAGLTAQTRLKHLLASDLFQRVRVLSPHVLDKVVSVCGDVTHDDLGLSGADRQRLADTVNVIFNIAATIRFDEPLRRALQLNVVSTQRVVRLALRCTCLEALVHVSTAYCTADANDVTESVVFDTISANKLLDACEWMDDTLLSAISKQVFGGRPSSYHLTKALAEQVLAVEGNTIPLAIVRPSIITASWREPEEGWVDNYNGLTGYLVAAGKGVLRTLHVKPDFLCDIIPVDIVVNTCLASAWSVATKRPSGPLVVNCTSGALNGLTWREIRALSSPALVNCPSMELFRYPGVSFHSSAAVHRFHLLAEHTIPAFVVDLLFRACGLKPILGQVYQKVNRSVAALQYFTCNQWSYRTDNQRQLCDQMSATDRDVFCADVRAVDWKQYFVAYVSGIRGHLLREKTETVPKARQRIQRLYLWNQVSKAVIFAAILAKMYSIWRRKRINRI